VKLSDIATNATYSCYQSSIPTRNPYYWAVGEFLMGRTFNLASGLMLLSIGYSVVGVAKQLEYSLTAYPFVFTMVGEWG